MSGLPDVPRGPGGAGAGEASADAEAAGIVPDPAARRAGTMPGTEAGQAGTMPGLAAGRAGTGADTEAGRGGTVPDIEAGRAGTVPDTGAETAGTVPGIKAGQAGTMPGPAAGQAGTGADTEAGRAGTVPDTGAETAGTVPDTEAVAAATARARALAARLTAGWPLRRIFAVGVVIASLFSVLAIAIGGAALANLASARDRVVNKIDPAAFRTSQLEVAFLNQETGVRGYALSAQRIFLQPYTDGLAQQQREVSALHRLLTGMPAAQASLAQVVSRAATWRASYAAPTIRQVSASGQPVVSPAAGQGKADFDSLRSELNSLQADLTSERRQAVSALNNSATTLDAICVGIGIALLVVLIVLAFGLERSVIRPLSRLAADARQVADGDFAHHVAPSGPQEIRTVGLDVNRMRERILAELSALRAAHASLEARTGDLQRSAEDLQRSNAELEQFAYVASHDLQEPLRKVASFCQLLQRRYAGQLDERADQYIEHAVDGAKRMQALINDLLAFSRVGRTAQKREQVSCGVLLAQAWANLGPAVRASHATIEVGDLPVVLGEISLLTAVFQNLLSNALKFTGDQAPRVSVSARRDGEHWLFSFTDNGIGIPAEYAERIFVIFQRLHDKATYPGTGIGLAMCRKIIEYHGGHIWLDTTVTSGARFRFTLPVRPEDKDADG
jgi:signal transduction histidine kinase